MPALLEDARPQASPKREDGEFLDCGLRPVFAEHKNRLGVVFGPEDMERIAQRCNERITKRGSFAPIVVRHTTDDGSHDPEVIGMAGPFRCGKLADGTTAIFARWRLYKEHADKLKKYPRVSVEYWGNRNDPTNGYFDPISVLGSECPELDLPVHYAKRGGVRMIRYQAVCPGGSNTHVPTMVGDEEKPSRYQGGTLSQEDLQQIVAALQPMIEQTVKVQVAAMNPPGGAQAEDLNPLNALDGVDPAGGDELDQALAATGDEAGDEMGDELDGGLGDPLEGDSEPSEAGPFDDDDSDLDGDDMPGDDDTDTDDEAGLSAPKAESPPKKKSKKGDKAEKSAKEKPDQYSANGRESETVLLDEESMAAETTEMTVTKYQKQVADLTAERDEYKQKYQKEVESRRTAETDLNSLKTRVDAIEAERRQAVRYQKLFERQSQGYTFDLAEELKDCEPMTDEQFTKHVDERIPSRYSRVPILGVTTKSLPIPATSRIEQDQQRAAEKRQRYSKQAMENCLKDSSLTFKAEFERLLSEDPEVKKPAATAA